MLQIGDFTFKKSRLRYCFLSYSISIKKMLGSKIFHWTSLERLGFWCTWTTPNFMERFFKLSTQNLTDFSKKLAHQMSLASNTLAYESIYEGVCKNYKRVAITSKIRVCYETPCII